MPNTIESYPDGVEDIGQIAKNLSSISPKKAIISISEYPNKIILNAPFLNSKQNILPIFINKSSEDFAKWNSAAKNLADNTIGLDKVDTHFWFDVTSFNDKITSQLKDQPIEKLKTAIIVSATWDGLGSALLPMLVLQLKEWAINSVALALLPSKVQPMDGQFNMLASIGTCASKGLNTVILVDRDNLESYIGVDRNGSVITGNNITNYLVELLLSKETLAQEISELSKMFDAKMFTVLLSTGASLTIYGSIENMINTALQKPLLQYDLADSQIIYALVRMPLHLKEKITQGKVELAIANCFKDIANVKTVLVAEPIYVEETNDRIDIALLVGGFDTVKMFASIEEKVQPMKDKAVKENLLTDNQWLNIVYKITGKDPPAPEMPPPPPEPEPEPIVELAEPDMKPIEKTEEVAIPQSIPSITEISNELKIEPEVKVEPEKEIPSETTIATNNESVEEIKNQETEKQPEPQIVALEENAPEPTETTPEATVPDQEKIESLLAENIVESEAEKQNEPVGETKNQETEKQPEPQTIGTEEIASVPKETTSESAEPVQEKVESLPVENVVEPEVAKESEVKEQTKQRTGIWRIFRRRTPK
jgi:hypothetical protein